MISPLVYAQLADYVYANVRSPSNQPILPSGWTDISANFGIDSAIQSFTGFSAGVFQNGNNIVISYEGTNPNPKSYDGAMDWTQGNPLATGAATAQLFQAALLYEQVKLQYASIGDTISFTGHSLGGGLASMMSVMFNQAATTFDLAPFAKAVTLANLSAVVGALASQGFFDPDLAQLLASTALTGRTILTSNGSRPISDVEAAGRKTSVTLPSEARRSTIYAKPYRSWARPPPSST